MAVLLTEACDVRTIPALPWRFCHSPPICDLCLISPAPPYNESEPVVRAREKTLYQSRETAKAHQPCVLGTLL